MALKAQSAQNKNQTLGKRIQHPPSTNFGDDFPTSAAKRLKRLESSESAASSRNCSDDDVETPTSPFLRSRERTDSELESDEENVASESIHKTDLESALPPVQTDKEAIREYEATKVAEVASLDLHDRLGQKKWTRGKSSIYVDAFNLALGTVLADEAHLFDQAEIAVFENWKQLSYESQYL